MPIWLKVPNSGANLLCHSYRWTSVKLNLGYAKLMTSSQYELLGKTNNSFIYRFPKRDVKNSVAFWLILLKI